MTNLNSRKVLANLEKKGFKDEGGDHIYLRFYLNGHETPIVTKISRNGQDIGPSLISMMARQLNLSNNDFCEFATCRMDEDEYIRKLVESGVLRGRIKRPLGREANAEGLSTEPGTTLQYSDGTGRRSKRIILRDARIARIRLLFPEPLAPNTAARGRTERPPASIR